MIKKMLISFFGILLTVLSAQAAEKELKIDLEKSRLEWVGKKLTGQHNGTVKIKSGKVVLDEDVFKNGEFEIDMTSIAVDDIKDPEKNAKLAGHLKSEDFFNVSKSPVAVFKTTDVKSKSKNQYDVTGNLTIKKITHPITFPVTVKVLSVSDNSPNLVQAEGKITIDRTLWKVKYGSGKFFEGLGDKVINDEFEISFNIKAVQ